MKVYWNTSTLVSESSPITKKPNVNISPGFYLNDLAKIPSQEVPAFRRSVLEDCITVIAPKQSLFSQKEGKLPLK